MGKCTFFSNLCAEMDNRHLPYRPCNLFACYVRSQFGVLFRVQLLTIFTFRLNSRHYVRKRSSADHTKNSFNYSSIRIDPPPVAYGSKFRESCVTISVHYSTLSDLEQSKSDHIVEPTLEVPQPVRLLHPLATPTLIGSLKDTSVIHSQSQILKSESIV